VVAAAAEVAVLGRHLRQVQKRSFRRKPDQEIPVLEEGEPGVEGTGIEQQ
jgi:hypothetical protein